MCNLSAAALAQVLLLLPGFFGLWHRAAGAPCGPLLCVTMAAGRVGARAPSPRRHWRMCARLRARSLLGGAGFGGPRWGLQGPSLQGHSALEGFLDTPPPPPPAVLQALPRLGLLLQQWSPLEDPTLAAREFQAWRPLLESEAQVGEHLHFFSFCSVCDARIVSLWLWGDPWGITGGSLAWRPLPESEAQVGGTRLALLLCLLCTAWPEPCCARCVLQLVEWRHECPPCRCGKKCPVQFLCVPAFHLHSDNHLRFTPG